MPSPASNRQVDGPDGPDGLNGMTLRTRLFLALLTLALAPTLVFAWFTLVQLHSATSRWYQSGVDHALEAAMETNRTTLTHLEAIAMSRAESWAATLPDFASDARQRSDLRREMSESRLDFSQVYARDSTGWRLVSTLLPVGVMSADTVDLSSEIPAALSGDRLVRSPSGVLGAVSPVHDQFALVAGMWLNPSYWEQLGQVREARENYARVGVLVAVARQRVWLTVAALALVIALGALFLARAMAEGMTEPLARLATALEGVQDGRNAHRLPESGPRELASLATSFNAMTARLSEARHALARAEREAGWRDVARRLSHELKNPLTPMSLSLHRLQRRIELVPEAERPAVRESIAALLQEVEALSRMAETFSQYARMPEPREEPLDLSEVARACGALHEPHGLTLGIHCDAPLPVRGDRLLLSRALHNLLVNAIEASPAGGRVEVETGRDGANAWVEVRDRGTGLDPALAARVFEPYVSNKNRGSGLGLSLVRDIAAQHRGTVTLVNRDGGGAQARLTLPLAE
jgi:nitrogen fixation/metabolism regulation signal transduction histidine kinase